MKMLRGEKKFLEYLSREHTAPDGYQLYNYILRKNQRNNTVAILDGNRWVKYGWWDDTHYQVCRNCESGGIDVERPNWYTSTDTNLYKYAAQR